MLLAIRLSSLCDVWPVACHIKKRQTQVECWLREIEAEINVLDDISTNKDLEQIGIYRQSVCVSSCVSCFQITSATCCDIYLIEGYFSQYHISKLFLFGKARQIVVPKSICIDHSVCTFVQLHEYAVQVFIS